MVEWLQQRRRESPQEAGASGGGREARPSGPGAQIVLKGVRGPGNCQEVVEF